MSWNVNKCFDTFPPKIDIPALNNNNNKDLGFLLPHIMTVDGKPIVMSDLPSADYYVIVFWNSFFRRPSNRLIKTIKKMVKEHPEVKTMVLYVNNHNSEIWNRLSPAQRELVQKTLQRDKN